MSKSLYDAATVLMPQGTYSTNQSFPALQLYPRQLATCAVTIALQSPPAAAATFVVEVASTSGGVYSPVGSLTWPAGTSGAKQVAVGANSSRAWQANNTSSWVRMSIQTSGAFTGQAWLTKSDDGGPGLGSRSYHLDPIAQYI